MKSKSMMIYLAILVFVIVCGMIILNFKSITGVKNVSESTHGSGEGLPEETRLVSDRNSTIMADRKQDDPRNKSDPLLKSQPDSETSVVARKMSEDEIRKKAEQRLDELRVEYSDRSPVITYDGIKAICTFPLPLSPPGTSARGGDFVVVVNLETGQVVDVKIWR